MTLGESTKTQTSNGAVGRAISALKLRSRLKASYLLFADFLVKTNENANTEADPHPHEGR